MENKWALLVLCWLIYGFIAAHRIVVSYAAPGVVSELNISMTQLGLAMSMTAIAWAIAAGIIGYLSSRVGCRKLIAFAALLSSAATWLTGIVSSYTQFLVARLLVGVGGGSYWGPGIALINQAWPTHNRGFALGFHHTGFSLIGVFVAGVVSGGLTLVLGWRSIFWCFGILGTALGILFLMLIKDSKSGAQCAETNNRGARNEHSTSACIHLPWVSKELALNTAVISLVMVAYWATMSFLPLYLTHVKGLSIPLATNMIGIAGLAGLCGSGLSSGYSDYVGRKVALMIAFVGILASILLLLQTRSLFSLITALVILGYALHAPFPLCLAIIPADVSPPGAAGTVAGFTMFVGEMVGIIGPILGGRLTDLYGLAATLWLAFGAAIVATVLVVMMRETAPRKAKSAVDK
jgi:predicted MFS family arabinose efflux permease